MAFELIGFLLLGLMALPVILLALLFVVTPDQER